MWEWDRLLFQDILIMLGSGLVYMLLVLYLDDACSLRSRVESCFKKPAETDSVTAADQEEEAALPPPVSGLAQGTSASDHIVHATKVHKTFTMASGQPFRALKVIKRPFLCATLC